MRSSWQCFPVLLELAGMHLREGEDPGTRLYRRGHAWGLCRL